MTTIIADQERTVPEPKIRQSPKPYSKKYGIRAVVPEIKNIRKKSDKLDI
jgi:hypothetical protein